MAAPINPARRRLSLAFLLGLAGCAGTEVHNVNIQTAAAGTKLEARQVVALVYSQGPDSEVERLLYHGGDTSDAVMQLRDHYLLLRPWLNRGSVGNTASGFVALRDPTLKDVLRELLWDENRYRAFLYDRSSKEVGHGGDTLTTWLPYARSEYGKEWIGQGTTGWWYLDEQGNWRQKE